MAQARIIYWADWEYVDKKLKEFTLTQEVIEKLDSIEPGAERNFIQWIKVNWEIQTPDQYRVVDLSVPEVEDTLSSYDNTAALSARQWRILYNYIKDLQQVWHFLSNWNCPTWLPQTNPQNNPYVYNTWDYFIVASTSSWTNYRPSWYQYISWQASADPETEVVKVWDFYVYDWTSWLLLINTERQIAIDTSLSTTSTNPVENRVITNAINQKQNILTPSTWINIDSNNNISNTLPWAIVSATAPTNPTQWMLWYDTTDNVLKSYDWTEWNTTWKEYTAWVNIQIVNNEIRATDTIPNNATISFKQWTSNIWSITADQSVPSTITFHDNITITENDYEDLPVWKESDWNSYRLYEVI